MIIIPKAQIMVMLEIGIGEACSSLDDYFFNKESKEKKKTNYFYNKIYITFMGSECTKCSNCE